MESPSIVSQVVLMPGREKLAAYSIVQELVAIWSTESWELEATVPTGPIGDLSLSPDESTLVAAALSAEEAEGEAEGTLSLGEGTGRLLFVDVDEGELEREARLPVSAHRVAWSPDGEQIALLDGQGELRFRSVDGEDQARPPVRLEDVGADLAWRPDGKVVAVALDDGGIVVVDPESGAVSRPLPFEQYTSATSLSWSPDGNLLAATVAVFEEESDGLEPGQARIWALGPARLERRMCDLTGGPAEPRQWRRIVGSNLSPEPLCPDMSRRRPGGGELEDASSLGEPVLAFERNGRLFVADLEGETALVGRLDPYGYPPSSFAWSDDSLAWTSPGQVHVLPAGAARAESWPCVCSGVAWAGGTLLSIVGSGRALVRFRPGRRRPEVTALAPRPGFVPSLIGVLGQTAVLSAFDEEPTRATPSRLFLVGPGGRVRPLGQRVPGAVYGHLVGRSADTLAVVAGLSGGVCYSIARVGILRRERPSGEVRLHFPPMPHGAEPQVVKSVQVASDGLVSAAIGPVGCADNDPPNVPPDAERYELRGDRWRPVGDSGWDVQRAGGALAVLRGEEIKFGGPDELTLIVPGDDEPVPIADDVDTVVGRP